MKIPRESIEDSINSINSRATGTKKRRENGRKGARRNIFVEDSRNGVEGGGGRGGSLETDRWKGSKLRGRTPPLPRQHCNGRFFNKRQLAKEAWKEVVEGETESGEFPARLEARRWETDVARYTRFQGSRWLPRKPREILHLTSHRGCDSLTLLPRQLRAPWNGD